MIAVIGPAIVSPEPVAKTKPVAGTPTFSSAPPGSRTAEGIAAPLLDAR